MLEANTDRMWFTIGSILIGAALVILSNDGLSTAMGSINEVFNGETNTMNGVVAESARAQRTPQPNLLPKNMVVSLQYHSRQNWISADTFELEWFSEEQRYLTFTSDDNQGFVTDVGDHTLSGYVLLNGEIPKRDIFATSHRITTYHQGGTIDETAKYAFNPETGFFTMTQNYPDLSKRWSIHTAFKAKKGDVVTIKELKFERGSKPTPHKGLK